MNDLQNIPGVVVSDESIMHQTSEKWLLVVIIYAPKKISEVVISDDQSRNTCGTPLQIFHTKHLF